MHQTSMYFNIVCLKLELTSLHNETQRIHTKKLCGTLYSTEIEFYPKTKTKKPFEPPFGGLRGNVRTPSIARWKARDRLPIRHN